jgi:hypothetical protein
MLRLLLRVMSPEVFETFASRHERANLFCVRAGSTDPDDAST